MADGPSEALADARGIADRPGGTTNGPRIVATFAACVAIRARDAATAAPVAIGPRWADIASRTAAAALVQRPASAQPAAPAAGSQVETPDDTARTRRCCRGPARGLYARRLLAESTQP